MSIFSKKPLNTGRQVEMDLLRGFTALNIIICHVGLYLGNPEDIGLYTFCDIFGSEFGAPVFMALMGISMAYSRHQKPMELFKRGISIFLIGYLLSFFRSVLPLLIFGNIDEWTSLAAFFVVDIMQFAGLSFIFTALLKKLKCTPLIILIISIVMVLLDQFIMFPEHLNIKSELLIGLINLFCPITTWSCFPFLTWFFFPAVGLFFGTFLTRCADKKKIYLIFLIFGFLGVFAVYLTFHFLYPDYTSYYWGNNFYYMGLKNVLLTLPFICFALAFWFFAEKILPEAVKKFLGFLSKNLNPYYIISWIAVSILIHLQAIYKWHFSTLATIGMMVILIIACAGLAKIRLIVKKKCAAQKAGNVSDT